MKDVILTRLCVFGVSLGISLARDLCAKMDLILYYVRNLQTLNWRNYLCKYIKLISLRHEKAILRFGCRLRLVGFFLLFNASANERVFSDLYIYFSVA